MKEYQARTADGMTILERFSSESDMCECIHGDVIAGDKQPKVYVLSEWETEAEADAARLNWLEHNGIPKIVFYSGAWYRRHPQEMSQLIRLADAIDIARNAPAPKVTMVEL